VELASVEPEVDVLWLYGSRARSNASVDSDFDLAIAFKSFVDSPIERRLRPELLALDWQKKLGLEISIVDFNQAPIQLAYTIVKDNCVIFSRNDFRLMTEEQKVMSKWELDHLYHQEHYA